MYVFYCPASITTHCNECYADAGPAGDDMAKCNSELAIQNCSAPSIDSCYTLVTRYQSISSPHVIYTGVLRGCIYCPSKKSFQEYFLNNYLLYDIITYIARSRSMGVLN